MSLHHAVDAGSEYSIISSLIRNGGDVNARDKTGLTVLHSAFNGKVDHDVVNQLLLARGADISLLDPDNRTVLHLVAIMGEPEEDETFGLVGLDQMDPQHLQPLIEAHRRIRQSTLQLDRQLDMIGTLRFDPVTGPIVVQDQYEFEEGDGTVVSTLLQRRASVNAKDSIGATPLYYACSNGHLGMCYVSF